MTRPIDIERALNEDYSSEPEKRNLQLEAKAHIDVQRWIDGGGLEGKINTAAALFEVHRRFCEQLPAELLIVEDKKTGRCERVVPGKARTFDVAVGRHEAVSPAAIPRFLDRYEHVYAPLPRARAVLSAAAAHHRLLWIHPFADGNGRVARLMSYATLLQALESGGVWSIARGLARKVDDYKTHLSNCDLTKRNSFDGPGYLSEEELSAFTRFFLETCLDQIDFMAHLMKPDELGKRILRWALDEEQSKRLAGGAAKLLEILLYRGEVPRREVQDILNVHERQAQRVVADLRQAGAIASKHHKAPWQLYLSAKLAPVWVPGVYP